MIAINPDLVPQLEAEFRRGWQQNRIDAAVQAKSNAQFNQMRHRSIDGLGQKIASIPPVAFHFWGQKLGYECWQDTEFVQEFLRDNPECRVNSGGTKEIQVGWTPSK